MPLASTLARAPRSIAFTLALLALPGALAAAGSPEGRNWDRTFTVGAHPAVHLDNDDGHVHVRTGPAGAVQCHVRWSEHRWGFTSPPRDPKVEMGQKGDEVTVTVRQPEVFMLFGGRETRLEVELIVPSDCDLLIQSGDGSVTLEQPVSGKIDVTTGDGRIVAHGTRGDIHLHSGDGAVLCDSLDGSVAVRSGDGHVQLSGRFDRIVTRTGDGRVEITANKGSRMADAWNVETQDGPLTVRIPRDLDAELDAHTGDGAIRFQLPVTVEGPLDHHTIRGMINSGGPVLRLRTGDGTLTLAVSD
jgi:hypothetical protein